MYKVNYQKFIIFLLIISASFSFIFVPLMVSASGDYGLEKTMGVGNVGTALKRDTPAKMIGTVIGAILSLVGILFLGLMIYGGLIWMLARGNEQEVEKAKNIIISAVFGLIIVLAAYAITAFVGQQLVDTGP